MLSLLVMICFKLPGIVQLKNHNQTIFKIERYDNLYSFF